MAADPHEPLSGGGGGAFLRATQLTFAPPFAPTQVHEVEVPWEGNEGFEGFGVPLEQKAPENEV